MTPEQDETFSAGETGEAQGDSSLRPEVIIGEIPKAEDPTTMCWTARCTEAEHDLLGYFDTRSEAEDEGARHMASDHASSS